MHAPPHGLLTDGGLPLRHQNRIAFRRSRSTGDTTILVAGKQSPGYPTGGKKMVPCRRFSALLARQVQLSPDRHGVASLMGIRVLSPAPTLRLNQQTECCKCLDPSQRSTYGQEANRKTRSEWVLQCPRADFSPVQCRVPLGYGSTDGWSSNTRRHTPPA